MGISVCLLRCRGLFRSRRPAPPFSYSGLVTRLAAWLRRARFDQSAAASPRTAPCEPCLPSCLAKLKLISTCRSRPIRYDATTIRHASPVTHADHCALEQRENSSNAASTFKAI